MVPFPPLEAIVTFAIPVLIGFLWIWRDANRRGQPGLLWALLTLPLSWLAILAYVVVRALQTPPHEPAAATAPAAPHDAPQAP